MDLRYRALLIGNSSFPAERELSRLDGPQNDVLAVRDALVHPEHGMFDPEHVSVLAERRSHELGGHLEGFFCDADRDDVLLLYYSGHGRLDERGILLLCAQDTRLDRLITTTVASDRLNTMINRSDAMAIVIVLDCCYSGAFKSAQDIVTPVMPPDGRGRYVMAACRAGELAADAMGPRHLSPFTHHIVAGLTGKVDKTKEEGFVSLDDLYLHVLSEMRTASRQTPVRKATSEGTIRIARSAKRRRPLSVAPKVIHVIDVEPGEELPVERVRVRGVLPGDLWTATTEARWIQITRLEDVVELRLTPQPGKCRANIEIINDDTGEARVVRVIVRPASRGPRPAGPDPADEKLRRGMRDLPPAVTASVLDFTEIDTDHLIEQVVNRVPGIRQAVLVTVDGLLVTARGPMGRDDLDRLAAGVAGLRYGGRHLAAVADSAPRLLIADLDAGVVMLEPDAGEPFLALYAAVDVDLGVAAYEMAKATQALRDRSSWTGSWPAFGVDAPERERSWFGVDGGDPSEPEHSDRSWLLDGLMRRGLVGCLVASVDGLALAASRGFPFHADRTAAVASSLFGSCRGVSAQVNGGAVCQVTIETHGGFCMVTPFGDAAVLTQFLTEQADLDASRYEATMLAQRVGNYFLRGPSSTAPYL